MNKCKSPIDYTLEWFKIHKGTPHWCSMQHFDIVIACTPAMEVIQAIIKITADLYSSSMKMAEEHGQ